MTRITTRDARAADAPEIAVMIAQLAEHHDDIAKIEVEDLMFLCFGPSPWLRLIVAEADNTIVGYAALQKKVQLQVARRFVDVQNLYVAPQMRGQGVGRALMRHAFDYANLQRCKEVALGVMPTNVIARAFYDRLGFKPHNRGEAVLMLCELPLQSARSAP